MDRVINPPPGFVKLPRSLLAEDWAGKPALLAVFVRLLLSANREAKEWQGITVDRGQIATSYSTLSASCGLTIWAVRKALEGLQEAGAARFTAHISTRSKTKGAARSSARGYTLVTICDFDNYEGAREESRTLPRTLKNAEAARSSARLAATTKEDIRKDIDISTSVEDASLFPTETRSAPDLQARALARIVADKRFMPIVEAWLTYKRERRESYKSTVGIDRFYARLRQLSKGDPAAAERIVNTAMANNWAGIFAEKTPIASTPKARSRIDIPAESEGDYKSTL